jgi:uridine kinase
MIGGFSSLFYYPFFETVSKIDLDPWNSWLLQGGRNDAFPYGLVLFIILLPIFLIDKILKNISQNIPPTLFFGIFLILIDIYIYKNLKKFINLQSAYLYLLSPLGIYINFIYFQTDSIVGLFLLLFCLSLLTHREKRAGFFLGLAIGSKFGVLVIIPFLIIFAISNKRFARITVQSIIFAIPISLLSYLPALWSSGFRRMVFGSERIPEFFELGLKIGPANFLIFPATYILLLFWIWRAGHTNIKVLVGFIGVSLFILSSTYLNGVGWYLWGLPIICLVLGKQQIHIYLIFIALQFIIVARLIGENKFNEFDIFPESGVFADATFTFIIILSGIWVYNMLHELLNSSDILGLNSSPIFISIAGDSGVGKDTLSNSIARIFGTSSTTIISGDSFHRFEREHSNWKAKTHLNPIQNNLSEWKKILKLSKDRRVFQSRSYNHTYGRFTELESVVPGDFIISQGLHALYGDLAEDSDLRVFLQMDERIRTKYKLERDSKDRKQSVKRIRNQISERRKDYKTFIEPQKLNADIIVLQHGGINKSNKIEKIDFNFTNYDLASYVFKKVLPILKMVSIKENSLSNTSIRIGQVDVITRNDLFALLENSLEAYDELYFNKNDLEEGAIGIVTCISLISIEYKRGNKN